MATPHHGHHQHWPTEGYLIVAKNSREIDLGKGTQATTLNLATKPVINHTPPKTTIGDGEKDR